MTSVTSTHRSRDALLRRIERLAPQILFGPLSGTYRAGGGAGARVRRRAAALAPRPGGLRGGEMLQRAFRQRSVFEVLLPDGDKLWDPGLCRIDEILDDEALVDRVADALGQRWPRSRVHGRPGTPAEGGLRVLVLKHLYDWSFDECEREVRGSLVYRAFCRIDCERVPDAKTLIRLAQLVGPATLKGIVERLGGGAPQRHVIRGFRMRVDTTVVGTN